MSETPVQHRQRIDDADEIVTSSELERRGRTTRTDDALVFETSGTQGEPKRIPYAYSQLPVQNRHEARAFELAGLGPDDTVMTLGAPLNGISGWASRAGSRELGAEVLNRSFEDYQAIIDAREAADVTALFATPLVAQAIGEEVASAYGPPREVFPNLRLGLLFGDHLPDHLRQTLRKQWGFEALRSLYGSVEADVLAVATDETQRLLPMVDKLVFEILPSDDDSARPIDIRDVTDQRTGSLLVSDPDRDLFPFTRYRIGDIVTVYPGSPPRLRVMGREDDTINIGGAPLYEQQLQDTIADTYGPDIDQWVAVVSRPDLKPAVDIYVAGADRTVSQKAFRRALFEHSPPLREAFQAVGEGVIEYLRVETVDSGAAIPTGSREVELDRDAKTDRIVFEDSYREFQRE